MKKKILKLVRILITTLMVFAVLAVSVVPVAAFPASFSDEVMFTPFHLSMSSYISYGSMHEFQIQFPTLNYDFLGGEGGFESWSHIDLGYDEDYGEDAYIGLDYSFDPSVLSYPLTENLSYHDNSVTSLAVSLYPSHTYAEPDMPMPFIFYLNGCLLDSSFSLNSGYSDGIVFQVSDTSAGNSGYIGGEFFFSFDAVNDYEVRSESGTFLSYFDVLYHCNYDFVGNLPDDVDADWWIETYETFEDVDFSDLTQFQIRDLQALFGWVGPIYGNFEVILESHDAYNSILDLQYVLITSTTFKELFQITLENSASNGLSSFQRVTAWLGSAVQGFFSVEILPNFSLGGILVVIIAFSLVLWWLKVFAGG